MDKLQQKLKRRNSKFQPKVKASFKQGTLVALLLAIIPYLFSLYESVPRQKTWSTFLFTYDSKVWEDANLVMWILTSKAVPLFILLLWFFTNRHWWYHALLVPIVMYIYQIFNLFNEDQGNLDESQIIYLLPIMAAVIPSIYLIRAKMFNKINDADKTMEELEEEFMIKPKTIWGKIKQYF
jgi:magnesium-transporting ATPase (P-type)